MKPWSILVLILCISSSYAQQMASRSPSADSTQIMRLVVADPIDPANTIFDLNLSTMDAQRPIRMANGTLGSPALQFINNPTIMGMYMYGVDIMTFVSHGARVMSIDRTGSLAGLVIGDITGAFEQFSVNDKFIVDMNTGRITEYGGAIPATGKFLVGNNTDFSVVTPMDTISKASLFTSIAAIDTIFMFRIDQSGLNARAIYSKRKGGTSLSANVIRIRSGSASALRSSAIATADAVSFLTAMESWSTLQNTSTLIGDEYYLVVTAISGTVPDFTVSVTFDKAQL